MSHPTKTKVKEYTGPPALIPEGHVKPVYPVIPMKQEGEPLGFFERPEVIRNFKRVFWGLVFGFAGSDLFIHHHEHFGTENIPGFYTLFSLVGCVVLFLMAKFTAAFVKREDDYYD